MGIAIQPPLPFAANHPEAQRSTHVEKRMKLQWRLTGWSACGLALLLLDLAVLWITGCGIEWAQHAQPPGSLGSGARWVKDGVVLAGDGTHYVLNGEKMWISNAGYAGVFTVFAKVPTGVDGKKKDRVTAFIVDAHAPGVSLGKLEQKMGIKASDTRAVIFEHVKVPVADRLGEVGQGFKIALEVLNSGRLGLAAVNDRAHLKSLKEA